MTYKLIELKIYSPTEILFEDNVKKINFQGKEGFLTILPNHIDYVSSFDTTIINLIDENNKEFFLALGNGVLVKYADRVRITAYKGVVAESLETLELKMHALNEREDNIEKEINKNLKQLEYYMLNNLVELK